MITTIGKHWWAYSKRQKEFDAIGYTKPGGDYMKDAMGAMEMLSKHLRRPIPADVHLVMLGTEQ